MKLQYLSDSQGNTTAVVIPIDEWNDMKSRHSDLAAEDESELNDEVKNMLDESIATESVADFVSLEDVRKRIKDKYGV